MNTFPIPSMANKALLRIIYSLALLNFRRARRYMSGARMKNYVILFLIFSPVGCAHQANLTPVSSGSNEYIMFYDRSDVQIQLTKGITVEAKNRVYDSRVKLILNTDPNTSNCVVVKGSVNFGEPGSGGTAKVVCQIAPPLEKDGMFNMDGSPNYRYRLAPYDNI